MALNITSVACTTSDALSAFLCPYPQKNTSYPLKTAWNRSGNFRGDAWLCTRLTRRWFRTEHATKQTKVTISGVRGKFRMLPFLLNRARLWKRWTGTDFNPVSWNVGRVSGRSHDMTRVFVMPSRARYYKCTSCPWL